MREWRVDRWARVLLSTLVLICGMDSLVFAQQPSPADAAPAVATSAGDDTRAQYPALLANSYFSVNAGYIDYTFSQRQLQPGFHAGSIAVPHAAVRVALFGHEFSPYVSAQVTYMRPVQFVTYTNVNGDGSGHHVWTGFGGLTVKARAPLGARVSVYGEGGLGIASRHGFTHDNTPVVADAHHASILVGAGLEYRIDANWALTAGATYSSANAQDNESSATLFSGGFRYTMRALPQDQVDAKRRSGVVFREHLVQVEYATGYGYGISTFLSTNVPVFWDGFVKVDRGVTVHVDRNVFHTAKLFALDFGTSVSEWRTRIRRDGFFTLSVYPVFRFTPLRTKLADVYFCYSLAGPTYISRRVLDGLDTGTHFTFQDFMGAGVFVGRSKTVMVGVTINHYSNGNIFSENAAVSIPLTFAIGWAF